MLSNIRYQTNILTAKCYIIKKNADKQRFLQIFIILFYENISCIFSKNDFSDFDGLG